MAADYFPESTVKTYDPNADYVADWAIISSSEGRSSESELETTTEGVLG